MRAQVGDTLIVRGHKVGDGERVGEVVAVRGRDDGPPYLVRWGSDGREALFFPGSDVVVRRQQEISEAR